MSRGAKCLNPALAAVKPKCLHSKFETKFSFFNFLWKTTWTLKNRIKLRWCIILMIVTILITYFKKQSWSEWNLFSHSVQTYSEAFYKSYTQVLFISSYTNTTTWAWCFSLFQYGCIIFFMILTFQTLFH